jgi:hypothetical protein
MVVLYGGVFFFLVCPSPLSLSPSCTCYYNCPDSLCERHAYSSTP